MSADNSIKTCAQCGNPFSSNRGRRKQFCSKQCYLLHATAPVEVRFFRYLSEPDDRGCVLWTGNRNYRGYGVLMRNDVECMTSSGHQRRIFAHRLSWIIRHGEIADDLYVLHRCDNPPCVNIDHLFIGTRADNNADMIKKGRMAVGAKCKRSHLTDDMIRQIRSAYDNKEGSQQSLADRFGISQQTVHGIVRRKIWSHVT